MAKLYIEIDTENAEDMKLFSLGRKGVATEEGGIEIIDALIEKATGEESLMITPSGDLFTYMQGFEVTTLKTACAAAEARAHNYMLHSRGTAPLVISAQHVGDDEKGN